VTAEDVVKRYGRIIAADGISFAAWPGAVTAVLGPNGAGKTTTIECCEGLRRPDSGQVRVLDADPHSAGPGLRARVGVMLQGGGLPGAPRAAELLRHVAAMHARPHPPDRLLAQLGLAAQAGSPVRRLSGGERQRLALALAIVGRPEVVFLDEPTAGLDPHGRQLVWGLVERSRDDGVAIVLTTHLLDEAERLADHVVVVSAGRVVRAGSVSVLTADHGDRLRFAAPSGLDLAALSAALPAGIRLSEPRPGDYLAVGSEQAPLDAAVVAAVAGWFAERGVRPDGLTLGRRTLEEAYLDLVGPLASPAEAG
jgi:ABC-2 type transport system ATP-binding protein